MKLLTYLQSTLVDLLGEDSAVISPGGATSAPMQNNEELLSQIFGGGSGSAMTTTPTPAKQGNGQQSINDILGLFGSTTPAAAPVAASNSLASLGSTPSLLSGAPVSQALPRAAPAQKSPGYVAYDKNSLKLTLNPQISAARPGIVLITARFEVTGLQPAEGVNFQAAVPKVSGYACICYSG